MRWSYSASRTFRKCQRQWYFKTIVANGKAKDPFRHRALLLSKLQTLSAWRGQIVDDIISRVIVPGVNRGTPVMLSSAKALARDLFDRQLNFALEHPINDPNLRIGEEGEDFCLLYAMEYGTRPSEEELEAAWGEIEQALTNLYGMGPIRAALKSSRYVAAQRNLSAPLIDGMTVSARPDAIAFQEAAPPIIIDWKVHALAENDAWLQLATYAIVLSRCKRKDFPDNIEFRPEDVRLLEVQLLTGLVREHALDIELIEEAEDYAVESAYEMQCLVDQRKSTDIELEDFLPAYAAESCQTCQFRSLCWEKVNAH
jgi:hypothetical protein